MPENVSQFKRSNMDNHQHYHVSCSIVHGVMQWGIHGKCPNDDNCRNVRGNSSDQRWKNSSRIAIHIKYGNFTQIFLVYLNRTVSQKNKLPLISVFFLLRSQIIQLTQISRKNFSIDVLKITPSCLTRRVC